MVRRGRTPALDTGRGPEVGSCSPALQRLPCSDVVGHQRCQGEVGRDGVVPLRAVWLAVAALPLPCGSLSADRAGRFRMTPGVGKLIETVLRNDLIIMRRGWVRTAGQHRQPAAVPVRRRHLRTPQPRDRQPLAVRGMGPVPARPQHLLQPARPARGPQQRRRDRLRELPHARGPQPDSRPPLEPLTQHAR